MPLQPRRVLRSILIALVCVIGGFWIGLEIGKKLGAWNSGTVWSRETAQILGEISTMIRSGADSHDILRCIEQYSGAIGHSGGSEARLVHNLNRIRTREIEVQEPTKP